MKRNHPVLAVVVPCYNEELVIRESATRLTGLLSDLIAAQKISPKSFIYFVDDGSTDESWTIIAQLHHHRESVIKGLKLVRNVGSQTALLAGLLNVREHADCAVTIDADLQHDEQAIWSFLEKYQQGAEVVYGVRNDRRTDTFLKKYTVLFFYTLMNILGVRIIKNHADYRLISQKALQAISDYKEYNLFLRGIFLDMGFKSDVVYFNVRERYAGEPKQTARELLSIAWDGLTSFSVVPLRLITFTGAAILVLSILSSVYILLQAATGSSIPGWASIVIPIYFIGGLQITLMGVLGEYVGKMYKEIKARPRFIKDIELF